MERDELGEAKCNLVRHADCRGVIYEFSVMQLLERPALLKRNILSVVVHVDLFMLFFLAELFSDSECTHTHTTVLMTFF